MHASLSELIDPEASVVPGGAASLDEIERRLAPYCARAEPRQRAMADRRGLLSPAERQTSGQWADVRGDATPDALQQLRRRARWDPEAVLVIDETGFLTKGPHAAGVARQYRGTAGRLENGQIGGFLGDAGQRGHAWLERALDLPQAWTNDRARCQQAGIPQAWRCATKPQLAQQMRQRALAAGVPAQWVTGDRVYGDDRRWRRWLEAQPQADALAVSGTAYVWGGGRQRQVNTVVAALPEEGWARRRAGAGATGPRWYAWCWRPLAEPVDPAWRRGLLVRRRISAPAERRASVVLAPPATTMAEVGRVAGARWTMESSCEAAKGEVGLDDDEVRHGTGWYRQMTLALWAYARLTVLRAGAIAVEACKKSLPPGQTGSSLAAFKVGRGLASRCASRRCAGWCGAWSWRCRQPPTTSWPGPTGAAGLSAARRMTTINDVGPWLHSSQQKCHCSTRMQPGGADVLPAALLRSGSVALT
jgi:SRSO17 transposase